jgi:hypothetical protein
MPLINNKRTQRTKMLVQEIKYTIKSARASARERETERERARARERERERERERVSELF